jgi:hypothetical protein
MPQQKAAATKERKVSREFRGKTRMFLDIFALSEFICG